MQRTLIRLPEVPSGAIYNPERGFFSVVIPIERTNLITNGSFETATTNWTLFNGATIARSTTEAYHGAYSLAVTLGSLSLSGAFYGTVSLTSGTTYAASCKIKAPAGLPCKIYFADTSGVALSTYDFIATGRWQWVWVYYAETSSTTRRIYITKGTTTKTGVFYLDGVQVEAIAAGETVSTYIDGDQTGLLANQFPAPYRWNGTPHASTSTRLVTTRAGGYVVNLDRFRFKVIAYAGLGLAAVANIAAVSAGSDGATYQTTTVQSRTFALNGFFDAETPYALDRFRSDLYSAIGPDSASPRQPIVLHYQAYDGYDEAGSMGRIVASYASGLEQTASVVPQETAQITFTQYFPTVLSGENGAALTVQETVTDADAILKMETDGSWSALGSGAAGGTPSVSAIAEGKDGKIYAGGDFTSMGGVANTDGIAYWDGSAWNAMGTGVSTGTVGVFAIAVAPNGYVYAGGAFSTMGGVANTTGIAYWNGSAWNAMSTGVDGGTVQSLAFNPVDGYLYAVGTFSGMSGIASTNYIARWNGSAWSAVGTGASGGTGIYAAAVGKDGSVYVGGSFTAAAAVTVANVAVWDGTSWAAMGNGLGTGGTHFVYRMAVGPNGLVYAGGTFTGSGSVAMSRVAVWNGTGWSAMGAGANNTVYTVNVAQDGSVYAGGTFTTAGGITLPDSLARWNGSTWVYPSVNLPGTATVFYILPASDGSLYIGYNTSGSAVAAATTSLTNDGTALAYPTVIINGPSSGTSRLYQINDTVTGATLFFNYSIAAGERVTLTFKPSSTSMTSDTFGDIGQAILPGSAPTLALRKGTSVLAFFADASTVTATIYWPVGYQSASDLVN